MLGGKWLVVAALVLAALFCAESAAAKIAIAPVVVEGGQQYHLKRKIETVLVFETRLHGVDPVLPRNVRASFVGWNDAVRGSTKWWSDAARRMGVDGLLVVRAQRRGEAIVIEARMIEAGSAEERRVTVETNRYDLVQDVKRVVVAALGPARADERELIDVEHALGRNCDEEYRDYMAQESGRLKSFAWYMNGLARDKRRSGVALAAIAPPLIAGSAAAIAIFGFRPWEWQECDPDDDDHNFCGWGDQYSKMGFYLVVAAGSAGTILTFTFGLLRAKRGSDEMDRLRSLLGKDYETAASGPVLGIAPLFSARGVPAGLALTGRF
jgi:hypothetical protein